MKIAVAIPLLLIAVSGCATRPLSNAESRPVPADRVIDKRYMAIRPESGMVTIKRDSGAGGSACSARIYVNAKPIADLRTEEKVVLHLPPNDYIFSAQPNGICGGGLSEVKSSVQPGSDQTFRIGYGSNGDFSINATAF